ncbi:MAG: HupE/UreJ family protein [Pseudomonadota bacterium]
MRRQTIASFFAYIFVLSCAPLLSAHEVRPAYLELNESTDNPGVFEAIWKQPIRGDRRLPIDPIFPEHCDAKEAGVSVLNNALIERWQLNCGAQGVLDHTLAINGLARTLTDVLVRVRFADGSEVSNILKPDTPEFVVTVGSGIAATGYLILGVEHLLLGFDHILFVIGLMLLIRRFIPLVQTITAFTIAHSITLALSALALVTLPQGPVEAVIALSILFLAVELAKYDPEKPSLTARKPWLVAFAFGLLHGFGFAGAVAEIGLPRDAAAWALFFFNVGVEVGQLIVVVAVFSLLWIYRRLFTGIPTWAYQVPVYALGGLSAYWLIDRINLLV